MVSIHDRMPVIVERKDYDRAASYFKRYLELRPNDLSHAAAYASVLVRMSRLDEAGT